MRRDNHIPSIQSCGLGLTPLFVSRIVSRFLLLRDQGRPVLRTLIRTTLAASLSSFVILHYVQQSRRLAGFLKIAADFFLSVEVRFSLDYLSAVSRQRLLAYFREVVFPNQFLGPSSVKALVGIYSAA